MSNATIAIIIIVIIVCLIGIFLVCDNANKKDILEEYNSDDADDELVWGDTYNDSIHNEWNDDTLDDEEVFFADDDEPDVFDYINDDEED